MGAYVENVLLRCDIRTATWLSHGDRNDEQQLGGARLPETDPGWRGRAVFGVWLVRRGTDGRWIRP